MQKAFLLISGIDLECLGEIGMQTAELDAGRKAMTIRKIILSFQDSFTAFEKVSYGLAKVKTQKSKNCRDIDCKSNNQQHQHVGKIFSTEYFLYCLTM